MCLFWKRHVSIIIRVKRTSLCDTTNHERAELCVGTALQGRQLQAWQCHPTMDKEHDNASTQNHEAWRCHPTMNVKHDNASTQDHEKRQQAATRAHQLHMYKGPRTGDCNNHRKPYSCKYRLYVAGWQNHKKERKKKKLLLRHGRRSSAQCVHTITL